MTFRSRPLLDLAKGEECTARIYQVCNRDSATTVSAHYPGALGKGIKQPDWMVAWCCSDCHDVIDGRSWPNKYSREDRLAIWYGAHKETMDAIFERGLVQVGGNVPRGALPKASPKIIKHDGVMRR